MAIEVYTTLMKEVVTWVDPKFQMFGEWTRLGLEAAYWVKRIPKPITKIFTQAYAIFQGYYVIRGILYRLVTESTNQFSDEVLFKSGSTKDDRLALIQFFVLGDGYNEMQIDPAAIWEMKQSVSKYLDDFVEKNYLPGVKWKLQTKVSKSGEQVKPAGDTEDAKKWLGKMMEFLEKQPKALEYRQQIDTIRNLGEQALLLIGEELG